LNIFRKVRQKDKFLHKPKPLPETARDEFGSMTDHEKHNPVSKENKTSVPAELPGEGEATPEKFVDKNITVKKDELPVEPAEPEEVREPRTMVEEAKPTPTPVPAPVPVEEVKFKPKTSFDQGFFRDFEKFLDNKNLGEEFISELLDKDLLHKMRQFHTQREEGSPFFFHHEDSDKELTDKMVDLQKLEEEWYIRYRRFKEDELLLLEKEAEIDYRLEEFKQVLNHIKQRQKLEKKALTENYFNLSDGRVIRSIGELRELLKGMSDSLFEYHVSKFKNDFADWVLYVFKEPKLAELMRTASSRKDLLKVLFEF